ncbi:GNAT family N-acetyltransferase [Flindersiella endophytica]
MSDFDVRQVHPDRPEEFRAWFDAADLALSAGRTDPEVVTYEQMAQAVGNPSAHERFEAYAAFRDGECVGAASLVLPQQDNKRTAYVFVGVPPDHRRRGAGTALFGHVGELATAVGRDRWFARVRVPAGASASDDPSARFAVRHGFTLRNTEIRRQARVPLAPGRQEELEAYAAERADGYRVVSWVDTCPEEYVGQYANLRALMATEVPSGSLTVEEEHWDAERQREHERRTMAQGRTVYVSAAIAPSGELAGHTRLYFHPAAPDRAEQGGTLVLSTHRGHRLGLAMKLANLRALLASRPGVNRIDTENAEQNAPMIKVNVQLGFEIIERVEAYQRDL